MTFFLWVLLLCEIDQLIVQTGAVALGAKQRIIVALQEGFFLFPDNRTTFRADKILGRLSECMVLRALIVFCYKGVAVGALSADITRCHAMCKADDFFLMATIGTLDDAGTTHTGKAQILLIQP